MGVLYLFSRDTHSPRLRKKWVFSIFHSLNLFVTAHSLKKCLYWIILNNIEMGALMSFSSLRKKAGTFEKHITKMRNESETDFDWYPYNSLNNFIIIEELLKKGKQEYFFDNLSKKKKVLDIGCADGDVAFFFEEQGYSVDVIDRAATNYNDLKGCRYLKQQLNSKVNILEYDVDRNIELSDQYGFTFAMGILYHLRNPFYFLNMLCTSSEYVLLSTRIASHAPDGTKIKDLSVGYLVGTEELNNDPTNYWIFSLAGIHQLIKRTGFEIICEICLGEVDNSTPHEAEKDERYFALLKRVENYKDIFVHHHF